MKSCSVILLVCATLLVIPSSFAVHTSIFEDGSNIDLRVYVSEQKKLDMNVLENEKIAVWVEKDIPYGLAQIHEDDPLFSERSAQVSIPLTKAMQNNATVYIHVAISKAGNSETLAYSMQKFNVYLPRKTIKKQRNLLYDEYVAEDVKESEKLVSFVKGKWTFHLVADFTVYETEPVFYKRDSKKFYPTLYINNVNVMDQYLVPVNDTIDHIDLQFSYSTINREKFLWYRQMEQTFKLHESWGSGDREIESIKSMFLETNPYLLYLTFFVSCVHLLFDFLAFKNDVSFWRNAKSLEGLSVRAIAMNVVCQGIVLMYLMENDTSIIVVGSCAIGVIIEAWKIFKALKFTFRFHWKFLKVEERMSLKDSPTSVYDRMAFKYVGALLVCIIFGYSAYSLVYLKHSGWRSWAISTAASIVYGVGFVRMTPQLFINYKLKSVAHMPWRAFVYKASNTFIDDLFAFIIKMPTMHRLSAFRDDVIFLIFLFQWWIYPVDKSRVNEYGQRAEPEKKTQ